MLKSIVKNKAVLYLFVRIYGLLFLLNSIAGVITGIVSETPFKDFLTQDLLVIAVVVGLILLFYSSPYDFLKEALNVRGARRQFLYTVLAYLFLPTILFGIQYVFTRELLVIFLLLYGAFSVILSFIYLYELYKRKAHKLLTILLLGLILNPLDFLAGISILTDGIVTIPIHLLATFFDNYRNTYIPGTRLALIRLFIILTAFVVTVWILARREQSAMITRKIPALHKSKSYIKVLIDKILLASTVILLFGIISWLPWYTNLIVSFYFYLRVLQNWPVVLFSILFFFLLGKLVRLITFKVSQLFPQIIIILFVSIGYYLLVGVVTTAVVRPITCNITTQIIKEHRNKHFPFYPIAKSALFPLELFEYNLYFRAMPYDEILADYYKAYDLSKDKYVWDYWQYWIATKYCGVNIKNKDIPRYYYGLP